MRFQEELQKSTFSKVASDCVDGKGLPLKAHFDLFYNSLAGEEKKQPVYSFLCLASIRTDGSSLTVFMHQFDQVTDFQ